MLGTPDLFANTQSEEVGKRELFIILSDKGLCGGIHSSVSKATRAAVKEANPELPITIVGNKSKAQFSRALPKNLTLTFNQVGCDIHTFTDAAALTNLIIKSGVKYDSIVIVYNKLVSAFSFKAANIEVQTETLLREVRECYPATTGVQCLTAFSAGFKAYDMEDDMIKDLSVFALTNFLYLQHVC